MKKAIIIVYGEDKTGIIYNVSKVLYENEVNILEVSQSIIEQIFNMMLVVDLKKADINDIREKLNKVSVKIKCKIDINRIETYTSMHKI